jgi:hypothetical protein
MVPFGCRTGGKPSRCVEAKNTWLVRQGQIAVAAIGRLEKIKFL